MEKCFFFFFFADHDRPLSKSGKEDAVRVSRKLQQLGWIPELILSRLAILWLLFVLWVFDNWIWGSLGWICVFGLYYIDFWCCSDAARTKETLEIMQEQVRELVEAEVHFVSSFYSIAAMDGQTAEHLQKIICRYSRDEILTVMWVSTNSSFLTRFWFFWLDIWRWRLMIEATLKIPNTAFVFHASMKQPMDKPYSSWCYICWLNLLWLRNHIWMPNTESQWSHISHWPFSYPFVLNILNNWDWNAYCLTHLLVESSLEIITLCG